MLILTFKPSAIILFSQVSHRYERLLESVYVSIIGRRRVTTQRELDLAEHLPIRACIWDLDPPPHLYAKYWSFVRHGKVKAFAGDSFELSRDGRGQMNQMGQQFANDMVSASPGRFHCSTMESFVIYMQRDKCMRVDPNYARDKVLNELDERHRRFIDGLCLRDRRQYYRSIIQAYRWSGMDVLTFNLFCQFDWSQLNEIDHNLKAIIADIEYIYQTVRKRIMSM